MKSIAMSETPLLRISSDLADAVNLVYYCGLSCAEAAKLVGISDSAMRNRIFQGEEEASGNITRGIW